jgi:hypothetical protein
MTGMEQLKAEIRARVAESLERLAEENSPERPLTFGCALPELLGMDASKALREVAQEIRDGQDNDRSPTKIGD